MTELLAYWPNVLFALTVGYGIWRYLKWVNFGFGPTAAEQAREDGRLIYDAERGEFVEVDDEQ